MPESFEYPNVATCDPNMLVPYYLMSSYLYYEKDKNVLSDGDFDEVCKRLDAVWDDVTHWHKHLVDRGQLAAGTCMGVDYPPRVKYGAESWYKASKLPRAKPQKKVVQTDWF